MKTNPARRRIENLDEIPYPKWDSLPPLSYYRQTRTKASPFMPIIMTRGCNERCIYCSKQVFGANIRFRSVANVEGEIEQLVKR